MIYRVGFFFTFNPENSIENKNNGKCHVERSETSSQAEKDSSSLRSSE
jgi:hypothetical protein